MSDAISYLPPWLGAEAVQRFEAVTSIPPDGEWRWRGQRPARGQWARAAEGLKRAGQVLKQQPIARIVEAIDKVAVRWCDRQWETRRSARERIARATGFSLAAVDESLDLELRNYRADSLWRTLKRELGDPLILDSPRANGYLRGHSMAVGPELVLAIFTGNVPGLPALSMVRSLLVKAPVIAKVASGEPSFAAVFADSLREESAALGDALLVTYWSRDEKELVREISAQVDAVVAYGGTQALDAIRALMPAGVRLFEHGHKLSWGFISPRYVAERGEKEVFAAIAQDASAFNQHACIAPQVYFVEGSRENARALAQGVAAALAKKAEVCPVGTLSRGDAGRIQLARAQKAWEAQTSGKGDAWHDGALEYTVALEDSFSSPEGLGSRFLRIVAVEDLAHAMKQLQPFRAYLQNVGLGCASGELQAAAAALAAFGASRICEPGRMAEPSMMWRHDGRSCVAELLRYCDVEMHRGFSEGEEDENKFSLR